MALITAATAREMALKGNAIRWHPANRARETLETQPPPPQVAATVAEHYRLVRVRAQLDLVDKLFLDQCMKQNIDAQALDRLASAQARLAEQERILDGRPMPGSLKPSSAKPARSRVSMPAPEPLPVVNSVPTQASPAPAQTQPVQSPEI